MAISFQTPPNPFPGAQSLGNVRSGRVFNLSSWRSFRLPSGMEVVLSTLTAAYGQPPGGHNRCWHDNQRSNLPRTLQTHSPCPSSIDPLIALYEDSTYDVDLLCDKFTKYAMWHKPAALVDGKANTTTNELNTFCIDSGASNHLVPSRGNLHAYRKFAKLVEKSAADGGKTTLLGKARLSVPAKSKLSGKSSDEWV